LEAALGIELAAVMIAIYMGDMNEQEAAEALMIPANIVRSRRSRATKILSETPGLRNLLRGK
jgi:DNA-directed RNA polymerase specialized sigma24 family protein